MADTAATATTEEVPPEQPAEGEGEAEEETPTVEPPPSTLAEGWQKGYYITEDLESENGPYLRTVNNEAVWRITGARPGNGVECLLDNNIETFWQSDGSAPHTIYIQFYHRITIAEIAMYLDYRLDESYTPKRITIRSGTTHHDLEEIRVIEIEQPIGWVRIPLGNPNGTGLQRYIRTWYIQIIISTMHQNGRDTHIRCIKVLGPSSSTFSTDVLPHSSNNSSNTETSTTSTTNDNLQPPTVPLDTQNMIRFAPPIFSSFPGGTLR